MRFVIGGADSGKRDFVRENYGIDEILMADYDSVLTAKAVYGFHIFIKKLMADIMFVCFTGIRNLIILLLIILVQHRQKENICCF